MSLLVPGAMYLWHLSKAFSSQMHTQINLFISAIYVCKMFNPISFFWVERVKLVRLFRKSENNQKTRRFPKMMVKPQNLLICIDIWYERHYELLLIRSNIWDSLMIPATLPRFL